jgi:hypothetical protein
LYYKSGSLERRINTEKNPMVFNEFDMGNQKLRLTSLEDVWDEGLSSNFRVTHLNPLKKIIEMDDKLIHIFFINLLPARTEGPVGKDGRSIIQITAPRKELPY